ncbi:MAG TPA: hypothetical protein VHV26_05790 [Rhizomicrobium sp.]|nr:hypothetical protein [Rhizomicrobium sp.]
MPRLIASPDQPVRHYTRAAVVGEAPGRKAAVAEPFAPQPKPKETTMLRIYATIAILGLSATFAQAGDSLAARIHDAAAAACAPERAAVSGPVSHYGAIYDHCVARVSSAAMTRYQAEAQVVTDRKLANN